MFLKNSCTLYYTQIIPINIVLLRSSYAQNVQAVHQGDKLGKLNKSNPLWYMINCSKKKQKKKLKFAALQKHHCNNFY